MREDERDRRDAAARGHAAEQRILEALGTMRPLPEVLDIVVRGLDEQIADATSAIIIERGGRLTPLAPGCLPATVTDAIDSLEVAAISLGPEGRIVPDFEGLPPHPYRDAALAAGLRSATALPIRSAAGTIGFLSVQRSVPGELNAHELELARRAAGIAAIVIERAEAEESLRESEQRLRQIAENLREGIWISTVEHQPLYISPGMATILGIPLETMYANGLAFLQVIHPEDQPRFRAWFEDHAEVETAFRILRSDGVRWLRGHVIPIRDETGAVYRFTGVVEDITEWKEAADRLRESEGHYRRLVTNAPVGIYAVDAEGRFTELNPVGEAILDRPQEDVIGRHFVDFVAPEDVAASLEAFTRLGRGESARETLELSIVRPSGERRLLSLTVSAIADAQGVNGLHGIGIDLTEERQRQLQLRRAERLASVGTMIGGVAHELNNPLTSIRGLSELMLGDDRSEDDREVLGMIRREADRMAKIVSDLRRLARETQESERESKLVDLNEIVHHMLRVRKYTLETSNVHVIEDLTPRLPCIRANPAEIEQVLLNLLVNAEQALMASTVADKRIVVRTRRSDATVALHVVDNGPGIPTESLERIFDPFYTTKAPGGGTGLGLSLVNSIVGDLGGSVRAYSRLGAGAEFIVEFPATSDAEQPAQPAASHAAAGALRILVVEDEPTIQRLLERMLERRGHQVTLASDGGAALRLLESNEYDVILSDLRMPGLSGEDLLRRLRERDDDAVRRLVFMTGDAVSETSARIVEDAGVPVLLKPFTGEQVAAVVERIGQEGSSRT